MKLADQVQTFSKKILNLENENKRLKKVITHQKIAYHELQQSYLYTMQSMVLTSDCQTSTSVCGAYRVPKYSFVIADRIGLSKEKCHNIRAASVTYDLGKIGIPADILLKPGKLNHEEQDIIKTHTIIGGNLLSNLDCSNFITARQIALSHHENWDGTGYPMGLAGEKIPLSARIVAIADVFEALNSERPYRTAFPLDVVCGIITKGKGIRFDPDLVDAFEESLDNLLSIK